MLYRVQQRVGGYVDRTASQEISSKTISGGKWRVKGVIVDGLSDI